MAFLVGARALPQTPPDSPADLIRYLTYQSNRTDAHGAEKGHFIVFSCGPFLGESTDDRALTNRLAAMRESALPAIEEALESFAADGLKSPFSLKASWLLLAYAQIKGPGALTRLRQMIGNPLLKDYAISLDQSVALSLGLTSYVSAFRKRDERQCRDGSLGTVVMSSKPCKSAPNEMPVRTIRCHRFGEPRDALDQLILACETKNDLLRERSLGPHGKSALRQLLPRKTWPVQAHSDDSQAVGYRFEVRGRWSEPEENLVQDRPEGNLAGSYVDPQIDVSFTNRVGVTCGQMRVRFSSTSGVESSGDYFVDSPDLVKLQELIVACANDASQRR